MLVLMKLLEDTATRMTALQECVSSIRKMRVETEAVSLTGAMIVPGISVSTV